MGALDVTADFTTTSEVRIISAGPSLPYPTVRQ